ncbi:agip22 [Agrotis ipsilon multiple nucleopolyhedrovirus]|uniref:Late expression factor-1 n=1 Tax=Agrotis ipsilon multiple nucleopolyhedrovirus TaxID=208013 RepID=B6D5T6_9ABAC|nr:agip22 [Agrotis ipsilon multiple nucleopolyhedrovirus]ACI28724.1 late expression factor-1 [Agrotis ipsilon multiple nucleopolyhedrovirus]
MLRNHHQAAVTYAPSQIELMWNSVAYRDCRHFAFFDGARWHHPDVYFDDVDAFASFINRNRISDVHAKPLDSGREWVIDVDIEACDDVDLDLKIRVATACFEDFFGENVARIMHTGNRGIHVWLRIDRFAMRASKQLREHYYKAFVPPVELTPSTALPEGCFAASFVKAVRRLGPSCDHKPLLSWWPAVDKHVFCNNSQIRVPFSYNYKGKKFSTLLH